MPRRKKKATEMTTEELARRVFPKQVIEELKKVAHERDEPDSGKQEKPSSKAD
jgi:hypothetical protein